MYAPGGLDQEIILDFAISAVATDTAHLVLVLAQSTARLSPRLQIQGGMVHPYKQKIVPTWGCAPLRATTGTALRQHARLSSSI